MFSGSFVNLSWAELLVTGVNAAGGSAGIFLEDSSIRTNVVTIEVDNADTEVGVAVKGDSTATLVFTAILVGLGTTGTGILLDDETDTASPSASIFMGNVEAAVPFAADDNPLDVISTGVIPTGASTGTVEIRYAQCYTENGSGDLAPITDTETSVSP